MFSPPLRFRSERTFPIPDDFFPPIHLTHERLAELRADASEALATALAECERGNYLMDCKPWSLQAEYEGLQYYQRRHVTQPGVKVARVVGAVDGHYRDLARFFKRETRAELLAMQKKLCNYTVDAAVVLSIPQHCEASSIAYEDVNWVAHESFSLRFRVDACQYEWIGTKVDSNGKPFAFRVLLPARFREVPDLYETKRIVRTTNTSVMILRPSRRNSTRTKLFIATETDSKVHHVPRSLSKRYLTSLHSLSKFVDAPPVGTHRTSLIPKFKRMLSGQSDGGQCGVCAKFFTLLHGRHECSACSQVVCRKCLVKCSTAMQAKFYGCQLPHRGSYKLCAACIKSFREDFEEYYRAPAVADNTVWRDLDAVETPSTVASPLSLFGASTIRSQSEQHLHWMAALSPKRPSKWTRFTAGELAVQDASPMIEEESPRTTKGSRTAVEIFVSEYLEQFVAKPSGQQLPLVSMHASTAQLVASQQDPVHAVDSLDGDGLVERETVMAHEILEDDVVFVDEDYIINDEDPVDTLMCSTVEVDTSEMARVRRAYTLFEDKLSTWAEPIPEYSETPMGSVQKSIYEQEVLLAQLQRAYRAQSCA